MRSPSVGRRVLLTGLGALLALAAAWPVSADAAAFLPAGHGHGRDCFGNGYRNFNNITVGSPAWIRGVQNASNANAGSKDSAQNASCKNKRYCRITQTGRLP